jgi:hypothetical protein
LYFLHQATASVATPRASPQLRTFKAAFFLFKNDGRTASRAESE